MKKRRLLQAAAAAVVAAAVVLAVTVLRSPRALRVKPGQQAPDVELSLAEPGPPGLLLQPVRGRPVLLGFFDTATPAGIGWMRELQRIDRRYRQRGLVVLGVSLDEDRLPLLDLIGVEQITFTVFHDPRGARVSPGWGRPQPPEAYLIDPQGRVLESYLHGIGRDDPGFLSLIRPFLKP